MCRFNSGVRVLEYPQCVPELTFNLVFLPASAAAKVQVVLACRVSILAVLWLSTPLTSPFRPNIHYHCNINYDPFRFMQENNKIYGTRILSLANAASYSSLGFTISMYEYWATIPTLWDTVKGESHTAA